MGTLDIWALRVSWNGRLTTVMFDTTFLFGAVESCRAKTFSPVLCCTKGADNESGSIHNAIERCAHDEESSTKSEREQFQNSTRFFLCFFCVECIFCWFRVLLSRAISTACSLTLAIDAALKCVRCDEEILFQLPILASAKARRVYIRILCVVCHAEMAREARRTVPRVGKREITNEIEMETPATTHVNVCECV